MTKLELSSIGHRNATLGCIEGLESEFSAEYSCDLFRRMCVSQSFERQVRKEIDAGHMPWAESLTMPTVQSRYRKQEQV